MRIIVLTSGKLSNLLKPGRPNALAVLSGPEQGSGIRTEVIDSEHPGVESGNLLNPQPEQGRWI